MAINLASKYEKKVEERFKLKSLSEAFINRDYDWAGVSTVKVYNIPTVPLNNYSKTGTNRYGTPAELEDNVQEMTVTQDKGFTFTIDKGNNQDQMNVKGAGKALARQIDEVIVPTKDKHRFDVIVKAGVKNGGKNTTPTAITKTNAYESFLDGQEYLDNHNVPVTGRIAAVSAKTYKYLKLDPSFVKNSDIGQKITINGQVGEVDGVKIVKVPTSYLPTGCAFFITHPSVTTSPDKLADYKIHDNPPGINGNLVEGRVRYDAFVKEPKKDGIYVHQETAISTGETTPTTPTTTEQGK